MYCPYCGTEVSRYLNNCPYCNADTSQFAEKNKADDNDELFACLPGIKKYKALDFHIADGSIKFDAEQMNYIQTYKLFNYVRERNITLYIKYIDEITDQKKIIDELYNAAASLIENTIFIANMYFRAFDKEIDIKELSDTYLPTIDKVIIQPIIEVREHIQNTADEMRAQADMIHDYNYNLKKDPWMGGGFGVKGAVKGAVQAKMLNIGTNAFSRAATGIKKASSHAAINSFISKEMKEWVNSARSIAVQKFRELSEDLFKTICRTFSSNQYDKFNAAEKKAEKLFCQELISTFSADYEEYDCDKQEKNIFADKLKQACKLVNMYPMESDYLQLLYRCAGKEYRKKVMELLFILTDTKTAIECAIFDDATYISANSPALDDEQEDIAEKYNRIMSLAESNPIYSKPEYSKFTVYNSFTDEIMNCWRQTDKVSRLQNILNIVKEKQHTSEKKWQLAEKYPEIAYLIYHDLMESFGNFKKLSKTLLAEKCDKALKSGIDINDSNASVILLAVFAEYNISNSLDSKEYQKAVEYYAKQGQPLAMDILGKWHYDGFGIYEKDENKAAFYFTYAGLKNSPQALAYIGSHYKRLSDNSYYQSLAENILQYAMGMNVPLAFKEMGVII